MYINDKCIVFYLKKKMYVYIKLVLLDRKVLRIYSRG